MWLPYSVVDVLLLSHMYRLALTQLGILFLANISSAVMHTLGHCYDLIQDTDI